MRQDQQDKDVSRRKDWNVFAAAAAGRIDKLTALSKRGVDFNARQNSRTPLFHALLHNQLRSAEYLLTHGAKVNEKATENSSHLLIAVAQRSEAALDLLYRYGADGACFDSGKAVETAIRNNDLGILRKLLSHGARMHEGLWMALNAVNWPVINIIMQECAPLDRYWFNEWCLRKMQPSKSSTDIAHCIVEHSGDLSGLPECMQRLAVCLQSKEPEWSKLRESMWWVVRKAIEHGAHHWETVPQETWVQFFWNSRQVTLLDIARKQNCHHMVEFLSHR